MNHPLLVILMMPAGLYLAKLWRDDYLAARAGKKQTGALPGATMASSHAVIIAVIGALVLLALETAAESALALDGQQTQMTWLFALYSIAAAPVVEEIIFRGWLVIEGRGNAAAWSGAIGASALFAVVHPFLWRWDDTGFALTLGPKGWFSTGALFLTSLWLYAARLAKWNPNRSLLPCFAAHAAKNAGVVAIKAATGFMAGIW